MDGRNGDIALAPVVKEDFVSAKNTKFAVTVTYRRSGSVV